MKCYKCDMCKEIFNGTPKTNMIQQHPFFGEQMEYDLCPKCSHIILEIISGPGKRKAIFDKIIDTYGLQELREDIWDCIKGGDENDKRNNNQ